MITNAVISTTAADCQQKCAEEPKCYYFVFNSEEEDTLKCMYHGIKAPQGNGTCVNCIRGPKYCLGKL